MVIVPSARKANKPAAWVPAIPRAEIMRDSFKRRRQPAAAAAASLASPGGMEAPVEMRGIPSGAYPAEYFVAGDDGGNHIFPPELFFFGKGEDCGDGGHSGMALSIPVSIVQF